MLWEKVQEFIGALRSQLQTDFQEVSFENAEETKQNNTRTYSGDVFQYSQGLLQNCYVIKKDFMFS